MSVLDNYPRPWRVTTTGKQRRTGGGYNYHIRAANDMYVVERVMGGIAVATIIVEGVNEREERDRLRAALAEAETKLATADEYGRACFDAGLHDRQELSFGEWQAIQAYATSPGLENEALAKGLYVKAFVNQQPVNTPCESMEAAIALFLESQYMPGCDAVYIYQDEHIVSSYSWADEYDRAMEAREEQD